MISSIVQRWSFLPRAVATRTAIISSLHCWSFISRVVWWSRSGSPSGGVVTYQQQSLATKDSQGRKVWRSLWGMSLRYSLIDDGLNLHSRIGATPFPFDRLHFDRRCCLLRVTRPSWTLWYTRKGAFSILTCIGFHGPTVIWRILIYLILHAHQAGGAMRRLLCQQSG